MIKGKRTQEYSRENNKKLKSSIIIGVFKILSGMKIRKIRYTLLLMLGTTIEVSSLSEIFRIFEIPN